VQQPPHDHRAVPDQLRPVPDQDVHAAEGVLEVVVAERPVREGRVEQAPDLGERDGAQ
jgi:hypothetical protein